MPVDVCAHITGTVWKIEVKEGDSVSEEQTVVILESMKMEMPVEAPEAGKVGLWVKDDTVVHFDDFTADELK